MVYLPPNLPFKFPTLYIEKDGKTIEIHGYNQSKNRDCFCPRCKSYVKKRKKANMYGIKYFIPCNNCGDMVVFEPMFWVQQMIEFRNW